MREGAKKGPAGEGNGDIARTLVGDGYAAGPGKGDGCGDGAPKEPDVETGVKTVTIGTGVVGVSLVGVSGIVVGVVKVVITDGSEEETETGVVGVTRVVERGL
jgi:hypothetical protein